MIISKLSFCAEGVIRDAVTNKISAFNIFDEISSVAFPLFVTNFCVFNILQKNEQDPDNAEIEIRLAINDNELVKHNINVHFQGKRKNRTMFDVSGLVIPAPGILSIIFSYEQKNLSEYQIEVTKIGEPEIKPLDVAAEPHK